MAPAPPEKACPRCGQRSPLAALYCSGCGHAFRTRFSPTGQPLGPVSDGAPPTPPMLAYSTDPDPAIRPHAGSHLLVATLLALLFPTLGQLYNGQYEKSGMIWLCGLGVLFLLMAVSPLPDLIAMLLMAVIVGGWLAVLLDAIIIAGRISRREPVSPWQWF